MTLRQLEAENAQLRELVIQYQAVAWLHTNTAGQPLRDAVLRLRELERWAAIQGVRYAAAREERAGAESYLTCATCSDRLSVSGGSTAVAAARGYFRVLHGGRKCRIEEMAVAA